MALGDILVLREPAFGSGSVEQFAVASGANASIKAGELVLKDLSAPTVKVWTANSSALPVVGTDYLAGLSTTTSTDTTTAAGVVSVQRMNPGTVYLGNADDSTAVDTQAEYDALVGNRVLVKTSASGVQTILVADGATYGLVIEPLNVAQYPGKIAFSLRYGLNYLT